MNRIYGFIVVSILLSIGCSSNIENKKTKEKNENQKNVIENILNRRSIRAYKEEQIKPEQLDVILNCGIQAPSARNLQPWAVRVIQSKEILAELNKGNIDFMSLENSDKNKHHNEYNAFFGAPTFILIAGDTTNVYAHNDCGMLAQNMLLAAESMNIGSCVLGGIIQYLNSPQANDFRKQLQLPDNYELFIGIVFGYKNEFPKAKPRDKNKIKIIE